MGRAALVAGIEAVYRDVFTAPPFSESVDAARAFVERLQDQVDLEGFRLVVAEAEGEVQGFAFGYETRRGQRWHDRVVPTIDAALVDRWFVDAFCLAAFAASAVTSTTGSSMVCRSGRR